MSYATKNAEARTKNLRGKFATSVVLAGLMGAAPAMGPAAAITQAVAATVDYANAQTINLSSLTAGDYTGYSVSAAKIKDVNGNTVSTYSGMQVQITAAGTYRLTGSATNVNVAVKKGVTGVVLVLDNVNLSCNYTAPIAVKKNAEATIVLVGTSTLTDNEDIANDDVLDDYEGAVIKAKDGSTLTLTGTGTLNVVGNTKHGIRSTCNPGEEGETGAVTLNVLSGTYNIKVQNETGDNATRDGDGIHSDDVLVIGEAGAADSALTINVTQSCEGLEGGKITVNSGKVNVVSSDDGVNAANKDYAAAGISYDFDIIVNGGVMNVTAGGDGLDSNGNIHTNAGNITVYSSGNGDGAIDTGDGAYGWYNTNATVVAMGQGSMDEVPASGNYVAFGNAGFGGFGGGGMGGGQGGWQGGGQPGGNGQMTPPDGNFQGGGGRGMQVRSADEADATSADAQALDVEAVGQAGGFGGGQMGGMQGGFGGGAAIITKGQTLTVADASGNTLWTGTAPGNAGSLVLATPKVTSGATYTLNGANTTQNATATAGTGANGNQGQQPGEPGQNGEQPGQNPPDGKPGQPGQQQNGLVSDASGNQYYYVNGVKQTGWQKVNGSWYYFSATTGAAASGWRKYNGTWYYLGTTTHTPVKNKWIKDGTWYYFGSDGALYLSKWLKWGGSWYYFGSDGKIVTNSWVGRYYVGADGKCVAM